MKPAQNDDKRDANSDADKVQGEGDYEAGRRYDKAAREFVEAGRVDDAAASAAPDGAAEARELEQAERAGKAHSKGESTGAPTKEPAGVKPKP